MTLRKRLLPAALHRNFPAVLSAAGLLLAFLPTASIAESPIQQISYQPLQAPNACLPDAIGFQNAYRVHQRVRKSATWSRVLMVQSRAGSGAGLSHAFCVFALDGKLWAYDQMDGCRRVWVPVAEKANAMKVGRLLVPGQFDRALWVDQSF
jgi:hypothetical protein